MECPLICSLWAYLKMFVQVIIHGSDTNHNHVVHFDIHLFPTDFLFSRQLNGFVDSIVSPLPRFQPKLINILLEKLPEFMEDEE